MNKFILMLLSIVVALYLTGCNNEQASVGYQQVHPLIDEGMTLMNKKAILDSTAQYNEAIKKGENSLDVCIAAGKLRVAYERAKEDDEALIWGKLEKNDCRNAGL